jgi:ubiquinone/menaquinone biosynthesis C-methylase UbiE
LAQTELEEQVLISTETTPATQYQPVLKQTMFIDVGSGGENPVDIARGDICLDLIKRPKNMPKNFICGDIYHLPFKNNCFDGAYCCEVIEHLDNPRACLIEIHRVLKPQGLLYLSTPNVYFYRIILREMRGIHAITGYPDHIVAWTAAEIVNMLMKVGFRITKISYATWSYMQSTHRLLDNFAKKILKPNLTEMNIVVQCEKE